MDNPDAQRMSARTATATWLVLVAATIAGWLLAGRAGGGDARLVAIVVIACAKIYLVMAVFMGLRRAQGWHVALATPSPRARSTPGTLSSPAITQSMSRWARPAGARYRQGHPGVRCVA